MHALRRSVAFLALALLVVSVGPLCAADWPNKPVTVIVPFGAGGNVDMMERVAAQRLSANFSQSFIVENRSSAVGTSERIGATPEIPAVAETLPGLEFSSCNKFSAPTGTPEPIIATMKKEIAKLAKSPKVVDRLARPAIIPGRLSTEQSQAVFRKDHDALVAAIKAVSITSLN